MSTSIARKIKRQNEKKAGKIATRDLLGFSARFDALSATIVKIGEEIDRLNYQQFILSVGVDVLRKKGLLTDKEIQEHAAALNATYNQQRASDANKDAGNSVSYKSQDTAGTQGLDGSEHPWESVSDGSSGQVLPTPGIQAAVD